MQANKQQKKQKYHCRFFIQGTCKNGVNCKFIHPVNINHKGNTDKKYEESLGQKNNQDSLIKKMKEMKIAKNQPAENKKKHSRDIYYEEMINTMRIDCYGCSKKQLPVYLTCGCSSICEACALAGRPCSKQNHHYDQKIYIK